MMARQPAEIEMPMLPSLGHLCLLVEMTVKTGIVNVANVKFGRFFENRLTKHRQQ